jgi:hypothetical protein
MKQQYLLSAKGVSFSDQYRMTAEERKFFIKLVDEENERMKKAVRGTQEL